MISGRYLALVCGIASLLIPGLAAQQPAAKSGGAANGGSQQGIYLVFPFENAGASPRLDWLGEGLAELTIQRLSAAGEQVYSRSGRLGELERSGLPPTAKLSRATMMRIAEELDADFVVFGNFTSDGTSLGVEARVLNVNPTRLLPPLRESGPLDALMDLHMKLIWRMLAASRQGQSGGAANAAPMSLADFSKTQRPLRLDAFEHYIRGILANEDDVRLRELREAARLEPAWPDPDFALGEVCFARRDCESAIAWFGRVPKTHARYVEAVFATGACRLLLNQPDRAEEVFTSLQEALRNNAVAGGDLPEVLNDLAVARARQGKIPAAQSDLRRAVDLDPDEDDYPFNLGLLALRANDFAGAAEEFREASGREPDNAEDRGFLIASLEKAGKKEEADQEREAATEALGPNALPTIRVDASGDGFARQDRIKTELDITALRLEIESSGQTAANASRPGAASDGAATHVRRGRQELSTGQVDAAESEFKAALAADAGNAAAHRGLAEVDRRRGKLDEAVKELQASLEGRDSAAVRITLARIYLEQKKTELARTEVQRALKLAPNYAEAKQLLERLEKGKPAETKPTGTVR